METMATLDSSRLISMLIFFQFTVNFLFYPLVSGEFVVALPSLWLGWPDPHVHQALSWKAWDSQARTLGSLVHQPPQVEPKWEPSPIPNAVVGCRPL